MKFYIKQLESTLETYFIFTYFLFKIFIRFKMSKVEAQKKNDSEKGKKFNMIGDFISSTLKMTTNYGKD